jgi:hypothetical protein
MQTPQAVKFKKSPPESQAGIKFPGARVKRIDFLSQF